MDVVNKMFHTFCVKYFHVFHRFATMLNNACPNLIRSNLSNREGSHPDSPHQILKSPTRFSGALYRLSLVIAGVDSSGSYWTGFIRIILDTHPKGQAEPVQNVPYILSNREGSRPDSLRHIQKNRN